MPPYIVGIQYGLFLSILVGPLLVALIQAGVEKGLGGGLVLGSGIWVSDILFILSVYFFLSDWQWASTWPLFTLTVGSLGAIVLIATGIISFRKEAPKVQSDKRWVVGYLSLWVKGFLINTVNPFTVFFWVFMMTSVILPNGYGGKESGIFFSALLGMIVLTDVIKILLAKRIRDFLDNSKMVRLQKVSGSVLIVFGVILFVRSALS